tara:strand:- start:996 stop:2234 length:1239 start_codon:yes stop_codon:yes gene_type:complete
MGSLFQGSPQTATSYTTSSTETPKWMQDAIFNQIQVAQNLGNTPYQGYDKPTVAGLNTLQDKAYKNVVNNQGFYQDDLNKAQSGMYDFGSKGNADALRTDQNQYLQQPATAMGQLQNGQGYFDTAGTTTAQALSDRALNAANPYLTAASQSAAGGIDQYMNPYQTGAMDVLARQGARNLSENLLPSVSDSFIRAGQFGSSRMGEFGSRALRDTQESVLNQQAQMANQGYGQALGASQADLARQAQLAGTVGSISGADLSRVLQGAGQYSNMGQMQTAAGQTQQQYGLSAAQAAQQAEASDYQRQMSALNQIASMQQQEQAMRYADTAALEGAGTVQQGLEQRQLSADQQEFQNQQLYPRQQMDWLSTQIRGLAPITPQITNQSGSSTGATYSASPLSQLASGLSLYKGVKSD